MVDDAPVRPRKKWGQHFLRDPRAAERIVHALAIRPGELVLEIGPGRGALTALLVDRAAVAAVEIDPRCARELRERFAGLRLTVVERDILTLELAEIFKLPELPSVDRLAIAGNLPYNISKPLASRLVRERRWVDRAVLMFQREVADRLVASPSTRAYGPLTVLAGEAYRIERLFDLRPSAFQPAPEVVSSVTRWIRRTDPEFPEEEEAPLRACLSACFAMRRRTLFNNLRAALTDDATAVRLLDAAEIDGSARAESLPPAAYRRLAKLWGRENR